MTDFSLHFAEASALVCGFGILFWFAFRCTYLFFEPGVCVEVGKNRFFFDDATKMWKSRVKVTIKTNNGCVMVSLPPDASSLYDMAREAIEKKYDNWDRDNGIYIGGETFKYPVIIGKESVLVMEAAVYFSGEPKDEERVVDFIKMVHRLSKDDRVVFLYENPLTKQVLSVKKHLCLRDLAQQLKKDYESLFGTSLNVEIDD